MLPNQPKFFHLKRSLIRYSLSCRRRFRMTRAIKIIVILCLGLLLINIINGVLFSSILLFPENYEEPDYDLDTRPYYRTIEMKKTLRYIGQLFNRTEFRTIFNEFNEKC